MKDALTTLEDWSTVTIAYCGARAAEGVAGVPHVMRMRKLNLIG